MIPYRTYKYLVSCVLLVVLLFFLSCVGRTSGTVPVCLSLFSTHDKCALEDIAGRYAVFIWHRHPVLVERLQSVRRRNPGITALMYRELFCVQEKETPLAETVGEYEWIRDNHPDWFQKDRAGRVVEVPDYPGRFMMDPGNPQWQDFLIRRTVADLKEGHWDGVFLDDVLTSIRMHRLPLLANYPDDASLQRAFYAFLRKAYAAFQSEGFLMVANVSNSYDYPGLFQQWLQVTDGILEEHFSGQAWSWGDLVGKEQLAAMQTAGAAGKWYFCVTYGDWDDSAMMDLSMAAYLVCGYRKAVWTYRPYEQDVERFPVIPAWVERLGEPQGQTQRSGSIWYRTFEHGVLCVNPSPSSHKIEYRGRMHAVPGHSFRIFESRVSP